MARWFVLRPTFGFPIPTLRELAMQRLQEACQRKNEPSRFLVHGEYGELHLPKEEHRFWSPHLSFYVAEQEGKTMIHGRFAPRLEIWTLVWVLYLAMAFTAFFSFAMAFSQWAIGESSWWHWPGIAALIALVGIYVVAHLGQQWSADQMHQLRSWLDEILQETKIVSAEVPPAQDD